MKIPIPYAHAYVRAYQEEFGNSFPHPIAHLGQNKFNLSDEIRKKNFNILQTHLIGKIDEVEPLTYQQSSSMLWGYILMGEGKIPERNISDVSYYIGRYWWERLSILFADILTSPLAASITTHQITDGQHIIQTLLEQFQETSGIELEITTQQTNIMVKIPQCPCCMEQLSYCYCFEGFFRAAIEWLDQAPDILRLNYKISRRSTAHTIIFTPHEHGPIRFFSTDLTADEVRQKFTEHGLYVHILTSRRIEGGQSPKPKVQEKDYQPSDGYQFRIEGGYGGVGAKIYRYEKDSDVLEGNVTLYQWAFIDEAINIVIGYFSITTAYPETIPLYAELAKTRGYRTTIQSSTQIDIFGNLDAGVSDLVYVIINTQDDEWVLQDGTQSVLLTGTLPDIMTHTIHLLTNQKT